MTRTPRVLTSLAFLFTVSAVATSCSGSPPPPASGGSAQAAEAPAQAPAPAAETNPVPKPEPASEPTAAPAPTPKAPAAEPAARIEVEPTKPGLTRIGADKCRMCHMVQYASWAESAHAKQTPPLDCESCHGWGSEYKTLAVMKDPAKAKEAGLVIPEASFCTAKCHTKGWNDDVIKKVHAHKAS